MSWWGFFYIEDTVPMLLLLLPTALSIRKKSRQGLLQVHRLQICQQVNTVLYWTAQHKDAWYLLPAHHYQPTWMVDRWQLKWNLLHIGTWEGSSASTALLYGRGLLFPRASQNWSRFTMGVKTFRNQPVCYPNDCMVWPGVSKHIKQLMKSCPVYMQKRPPCIRSHW